LVEKFQVKSFPTLLVIKLGEEHPVKYDDKLNSEDLIKFLNPFAKPKQQQQQQQQQQQPPAPKEPQIPSGILFHIKEQKEFDNVCLNQTGICVITFLSPESSEEEEHNGYIATYNTVMETFKKQFRFLWMDGIAQEKLANYFNLRSGFPALIVLNPKKNRYMYYVGAFETESLTNFLNGILNGSKRTIEYKLPLPIINEESPKTCAGDTCD